MCWNAPGIVCEHPIIDEHAIIFETSPSAVSTKRFEELDDAYENVC
jgi:hypothetical protein